MYRPKIGLTSSFPSPAPEILSEFCDTEGPSTDTAMNREDLLNIVKNKDGLICMVADKNINKEVFDISQNLKVVSTYSVGFDHIDLKEATNRGIYVTNTPGVLTEATADLAWALLMTVARRVSESDRYVRAGKWTVAWTPGFMTGEDVYGRTLGIVGLGRIGIGMAKRARGFNMKLLYYDVIRAPPEVEKELNIEYTSFENILKESDFITLHVALTEDTKNMINEESLRKMKSTAYIINDSRGGVIDQNALAIALKEKWIAGAGLDVYEKEPIDVNDPLLKLENVVLAPHIGSGSKQSRSMMAELAAKNLVSVLKGEMPPALVNKEVLEVNPLDKIKMI